MMSISLPGNYSMDHVIYLRIANRSNRSVTVSYIVSWLLPYSFRFRMLILVNALNGRIGNNGRIKYVYFILIGCYTVVQSGINGR